MRLTLSVRQTVRWDKVICRIKVSKEVEIEDFADDVIF